MWKSPSSFLIVVLVLAASAAAQRADSPRLPQPVSVAELQRFGVMLGLSPEQHVGVEAAYDDYLDAFDPLRREMIEAAVANPDMHRSGDVFTGLLPPFVERTRMFDAAFFESIEPLLIDAQRDALPRVRDLRDRTMLGGVHALWRFTGDGIPDLRSLLESLEPSREVLTPHIARLTEYELRLTAGTRQCFDAAMRLCGSAEPDDQAIDRLVDGVKSLRSLNRRLFDDLAPVLPDDVRAAWRDEYLPRAYGHSATVSKVHALARIDAALATELSDSERSTLQSLRDQAAEFENAAIREMLDLFDAHAISKAPEQGAAPEPGYYEAVNAKQQEVMARSAEFTKSVAGIIGPERAKTLQPARGRYVQTSGGLASACGVRTNYIKVYDADERSGVPFNRSDPVIPAPLDADCAALIAAALHLDQQQSAETAARLASAQAALDETLKPLHQELMHGSRFRRPTPGSDDDPLELARKADAVRTQMRTLIGEANAVALEEIRVSLAVPPDDPRWQRLARVFARRQVTLDNILWNQNKPNTCGDIDLVPSLLRSELTDESWIAIEPLVAAYESGVMGLRQELFDAYRPASVEEIAQRLGWRGRSHDAGEESLHTKYRAIAALNRETADGITAALPPESAAAFLEHFERAAYPIAFDDHKSAMPMLERTSQWSDLTEAQRSRIGELRIALDETTQRIQREMVQVCAAVMPDMPAIGLRWTPERMTQHERFTLEFERLVDQRAQANRRAARGLRLTLTAEQFQRVSVPSSD